MALDVWYTEFSIDLLANSLKPKKIAEIDTESLSSIDEFMQEDGIDELTKSCSTIFDRFRTEARNIIEELEQQTKTNISAEFFKVNKTSDQFTITYHLENDDLYTTSTLAAITLTANKNSQNAKLTYQALDPNSKLSRAFMTAGKAKNPLIDVANHIINTPIQTFFLSAIGMLLFGSMACALLWGPVATLPALAAIALIAGSVSLGAILLPLAFESYRSGLLKQLSQYLFGFVTTLFLLVAVPVMALILVAAKSLMVVALVAFVIFTPIVIVFSLMVNRIYHIAKHIINYCFSNPQPSQDLVTQMAEEFRQDFDSNFEKEEADIKIEIEEIKKAVKKTQYEFTLTEDTEEDTDEHSDSSITRYNK